MTQLRISEIFKSLQGEAVTVGWPTVFIRLTGCPLRCGYCDTSYAFQGGESIAIDTILARVSAYQSDYICVTGGEPLAQKNVHLLLNQLCDASYSVSLETSGALSIAQVDARVQIVMDLKTPGSGEQEKNKLENFEFLKPNDVIKFVIKDQADYDWAKQMISEYKLYHVCELLMSPVYGIMPAPELAEWILKDNLAVRFQVQLHKILWGEQPGK